MTTRDLTPPEDALSAPALAADARLEVILDEIVRSHEVILPEDFVARVMAARPYAAWEVRRAGSWRAPLAVAASLAAASFGLALGPLWSLGPATAATMWAELLALGFAKPLGAALTMAPALADALHRTPTAAAALLPAGLAGLLGLAAAPLALRARRGRRLAAHAARA